MTFNEIIKARRLQLNMTLEDVGNKVGVSKATILRWESGEIKNQRRDKIAKLAVALQMTPAELMGWGNVAKTLPPLPEEELDARLLPLLLSLSSDEVEKLIAFAEGLKAARK